jgi:hypothetical protein
MHKFNVCDTKCLEVHFNYDMFRWHIYHHHQGERVHTETWDATGKVKSFLLGTHCQSRSTETPVHRAWTALYTHCVSHALWSDSDNVYITRRTLSHQWNPSFRYELSFPDDGGIDTTET